MYLQSVTLDVCTWAMIACSQMQSSCFCSHYLCKKGSYVNRNNGSMVKPSANNYRFALIAQAHNQSPVPIESNLLKMQQQRTCRAAYRLGCNKHNTTHLLVANYILSSVSVLRTLPYLVRFIKQAYNIHTYSYSTPTLISFISLFVHLLVQSIRYAVRRLSVRHYFIYFFFKLIHSLVSFLPSLSLPRSLILFFIYEQ